MGCKGGFPVSVHHFVDSSHCVVITTCSGDLTFSEILASLVELRSDPQFDPGFNQLGDLSHVSHVTFGITELQELFQAHDPFSNRGRRAFVTSGFGNIHDLACAYQLMVPPTRLSLFRSMEEAVSWLDLGITMIDPLEFDSPDALTRLPSDEPKILDLPADVPRSFRGFSDGAIGVTSKH
jgi:hypothetical protein